MQTERGPTEKLFNLRPSRFGASDFEISDDGLNGALQSTVVLVEQNRGGPLGASFRHQCSRGGSNRVRLLRSNPFAPRNGGAACLRQIGQQSPRRGRAAVAMDFQS